MRKHTPHGEPNPWHTLNLAVNTVATVRASTGQSVKTDIEPLSKAIREVLSKTVDFLVLDSPPHLDAALGAVIGLSDVAVLPCGPSGLDLIATAETVGLVREIRKARGDGRPLITLVPNRVDLRTSAGRQLVTALEELGEDVSPSIHSRTALADSFNLGAWVGAYAPQSAAYLEIVAVTSHILKLLGRKPGKKRAADSDSHDSSRGTHVGD